MEWREKRSAFLQFHPAELSCSSDSASTHVLLFICHNVCERSCETPYRESWSACSVKPDKKLNHPHLIIEIALHSPYQLAIYKRFALAWSSRRQISSRATNL